jgi:hypothetical protein
MVQQMKDSAQHQLHSPLRHTNEHQKGGQPGDELADPGTAAGKGVYLFGAYGQSGTSQEIKEI